MSEKKTHNSTFFICMNTNKTLEQLGEKKAILIDKGMQYLIKTITQNKNYFIGHNKNPLTKTEIDKIFSVKCDYNIEIGEKKHRFHTNLIIETEHNTFLKLNKDALLHFFEQIVEDKCSIKIKATGDSVKKLKEYALKERTSVLKKFKNMGNNINVKN